jgi:hypothetical protein
MNTPARFESLLWMASPMAAWAQAGASPAPLPQPAARKRKTSVAKARRKGSKTVA